MVFQNKAMVMICKRDEDTVCLQAHEGVEQGEHEQGVRHEQA